MTRELSVSAPPMTDAQLAQFLGEQIEKEKLWLVYFEKIGNTKAANGVRKMIADFQAQLDSLTPKQASHSKGATHEQEI